MSLNVLPNGQGNTKGTHISFFVSLIAGEYDDSLEWPFQGEVTVELLNRVPSQHCSGKGWGRRRFISHDELEYNQAANCQYLKEDSLYFRVSVKDGISHKLIYTLCIMYTSCYHYIVCVLYVFIYVSFGLCTGVV